MECGKPRPDQVTQDSSAPNGRFVHLDQLQLKVAAKSSFFASPSILCSQPLNHACAGVCSGANDARCGAGSTCAAKSTCQQVSSCNSTTRALSFGPCYGYCLARPCTQFTGACFLVGLAQALWPCGHNKMSSLTDNAAAHAVYRSVRRLHAIHVHTHTLIWNADLPVLFDCCYLIQRDESSFACSRRRVQRR